MTKVLRHGKVEPDELLVTTAIEAYRQNGEARYQGFFYGTTTHVIRDLSRSGYAQLVWEKFGPGELYQTAHEAMMAELERLRFAAVVEAVIADHAAALARAERDAYARGLAEGRALGITVIGG